MKINKHEYEFLTNQWEGVKGAAYNQVYEFCKESGLISGVFNGEVPMVTPKGDQAVRAYQSNDNYLRIDVI